MRSRTRQVRWFAPCCLHSGVNSAVPAGGTHTLSSTVPRTPSHVVTPWLPVYPLEFPFSWQINVIVRPQGRIRARFQVFSLGLFPDRWMCCVRSPAAIQHKNSRHIPWISLLPGRCTCSSDPKGWCKRHFFPGLPSVWSRNVYIIFVQEWFISE